VWPSDHTVREFVGVVIIFTRLVRVCVKVTLFYKDKLKGISREDIVVEVAMIE